MPFGTEVFVHVDPEYSYFLNVVIIAAPGDYGNARGLCGNFNGDPADDLQDSSGSTVTTDADFVSAWRYVLYNSLPNDNGLDWSKLKAFADNLNIHLNLC